MVSSNLGRTLGSDPESLQGSRNPINFICLLTMGPYLLQPRSEALTPVLEVVANGASMGLGGFQVGVGAQQTT